MEIPVRIPGMYPGQEKGRDRCAATGQRINDQDIARRYGQSGGGRCDVHRGTEITVVAFLFHFRCHDRPDRRSGGGCRTGNGAEEHIGNDIHKGQSSGQSANQDAGKINEPYGDASRIHDVACQDEKGDGQQRETVESGGHSLGKGRKGRQGIDGEQHGDDPGNADAEGDRHTDGQQDNKTEDKNQDFHKQGSKAG